jgi:hypothetical protein
VLMASVNGAVARLSDRPHGVLYFYYSGHADEVALYPGGQALPMAGLRRIIDEAHVATKIGLVDACRGGGWTRAKGLVPDEPFAVHWPMTLDSEGSVLIASSSGQESAHESDHLQGSFFTVHFAAGLRGAADSNGNKEVTLTEAFDYARDLTIRDTVRLARETQHPSYAVNLRGRRDLVLAQVDASPTTVQVNEREGPLQIIHADSGLEMVDIPAGQRQIRIAVPAGRYLVRKSTAAGNLIQEITVTAGVGNRVDERDLVLVGSDRLVAKAPSPRARAVVVEPTSRPPPTVRVATVAPPAPAPRAATFAPPASDPSTDSQQRPGFGFRAAGWTVAVVAALATAGAVKWSLDSIKIDRDLDIFRRFPCRTNVSPTGLCATDGSPAPPLNSAEQNYVEAKKSDGRRLRSYGNVAFVAAGVTALTSAVLLWAGYRTPSESRTALQLLPLADADGGMRPGLVLAGRM